MGLYCAFILFRILIVLDHDEKNSILSLQVNFPIKKWESFQWIILFNIVNLKKTIFQKKNGNLLITLSKYWVVEQKTFYTLILVCRIYNFTLRCSLKQAKFTKYADFCGFCHFCMI